MRNRAILGAVAASGLFVVAGVQLGLIHDANLATNMPVTPAKPSGQVPIGVAPTATPAPNNPTIPPATAPTVAPASISGTYKGAVVDTPYGTVQVSVTLTASKITDVTALKLTDSDSRSTQISNRAAPILRSEALASQSASVSSVSGATYTSNGYINSLQSALDNAGLKK